MVEDPDAFVRGVAKQLADARKAAGITTEELAERMGTAAQNVRRIEGGKQNLTLKMIARYAAAIGAKVTLTVDASSAKGSAGRPRK